jgi:hypothetical protein
MARGLPNAGYQATRASPTDVGMNSMVCTTISQRLGKGNALLLGAPALAGSDVVVAGMSATAQWVKPLPVGASGSYMDTTKLFVSFAFQLLSGELCGISAIGHLLKEIGDLRANRRSAGNDVPARVLKDDRRREPLGEHTRVRRRHDPVRRAHDVQ